MNQELVRGLGGDFGEKFFDLDVGEDDVGLTLEGFVITSFEPVSFLRRPDEGSSFDQKMLYLNKQELGLVIQEFINANHQLR